MRTTSTLTIIFQLQSFDFDHFLRFNRSPRFCLPLTRRLPQLRIRTARKASRPASQQQRTPSHAEDVAWAIPVFSNTPSQPVPSPGKCWRSTPASTITDTRDRRRGIENDAHVIWISTPWLPIGCRRASRWRPVERRAMIDRRSCGRGPESPLDKRFRRLQRNHRIRRSVLVSEHFSLPSCAGLSRLCNSRASRAWRTASSQLAPGRVRQMYKPSGPGIRGCCGLPCPPAGRGARPLL